MKKMVTIKGRDLEKKLPTSLTNNVQVSAQDADDEVLFA